MPKIAMISHARHSYQGRALVSGQQFEVDGENDAEDLRVLGFASPVQAKAPTYATKPMVAEPAGVETAKAQAVDDVRPAKVKRQYNRRDMTAAR